MECFKRLSFEHEREFRGIIFTPPNDIPAVEGDEYGVYVANNIETLIEWVFVAPHAPRWQAELLESVVRKYGLAASVIHSDLMRAPQCIGRPTPPAS